MKHPFLSLTLAAMLAVSITNPSAGESKTMVDISREISMLKKDINTLKSDRGSEFAAVEISQAENHISQAEQLSSNNPTAAVEQLSGARYHLILGQEKTRKALLNEKLNAMNGYNASFGLSGTFGRYKMHTTSGEMNTVFQNGYGWGVTFEKMYNNRFGLHSGLSYMTYSIIIKNIDLADSDITWETSGIYLPLMLITSFNSKNVSLCFLTGLGFYNMFDSSFKINDTSGATINADVLPNINKRFVMGSGGIMLKFRLGDYTDFFMGTISEISIENLTLPLNTAKSHMYNIRGISGLLFRTDIFPLSAADRKQ